jgi:glycosyltransferase involved in cell wall biosynthesis
MKLTIISHDLSSNAAMRAHRLGLAGQRFAEVELLGPVADSGAWSALPPEPWIRTVPKRRFPAFFDSFRTLVERADGDLLIAVKPNLASFGAALVAAERRRVPVILDLDDLDTALAPAEAWESTPSMADLARPGSAVYTSLLTRAVGAADAITVASRALQRRFGGTLVPHGALTDVLDPALVDRERARREVGFEQPTVLFPGTPRDHKGVRELAEAVRRLENTRLAVLCRPGDLTGPDWQRFRILRLPQVPLLEVGRVLAAADVVAIPQLDDEAGRHQTPMKVFDAMAMGRPIVATRVSDLPEVLDGCARLVRPGAVDELASALAALLGEPDDARALGERARKRAVERYSTAQVAAILRGVVSRAAR